MEQHQQQQQQEKQALLDLYNLCDGAGWRIKTNWCSDHPLQDWYGVTIDRATGRVIRLDLSDNDLTGDISKWTSIASLTQLIYSTVTKFDMRRVKIVILF